MIFAGAADQVAEAEAAAPPAAGSTADTARGTAANSTSASAAAAANSAAHCCDSPSSWRSPHGHYGDQPASGSPGELALTWQKWSQTSLGWFK